MKTTLGTLRDLTRRMLAEHRIGASTQYMKKERVRERLQGFIAGILPELGIKDQAGLDELWGTIDMSFKALRMVPFEVWGRLANGR